MTTINPAARRRPGRPPTHILADSMTMLRRSVKHMLRYPSMTLILVGMPVAFLLLFVYVLGGTLGAGLGRGGGSGGGDVSAYLRYVVPGILLMTIAAAGNGTAVSVAMDMREGLVARFRTMAISRTAILSGHVLGSVIQCLISVGIVLVVALALGFRPTGNAVGWLLAVVVLTAISFAITWLCVALGMVSKSVETASNLPMPLTLLPFLSSGFVPTDSMPSWLRVFAEYQPFTPFIETVRGLLMGSPIGMNGWITAAWCAVIAAFGFVWSLRLYERSSTR